jgi:hypothetical protein
MKWKYKALMALVLITQLSATPENNESKRFTTITFNQQIILQDSHSKLEWINGKEVKSQNKESNQTIEDGCISFNATPANNHIIIKEKAENYCKELNFASYKDWRVPTDIEYQTFIKAINDTNISLHYNSPSCINALGVGNDKLNVINTTNKKIIGKITPFNLTDSTICLRCVRDAESPLTP